METLLMQELNENVVHCSVVVSFNSIDALSWFIVRKFTNTIICGPNQNPYPV